MEKIKSLVSYKTALAGIYVVSFLTTLFFNNFFGIFFLIAVFTPCFLVKDIIRLKNSTLSKFFRLSLVYAILLIPFYILPQSGLVPWMFSGDDGFGLGIAIVLGTGILGISFISSISYLFSTGKDFSDIEKKSNFFLLVVLIFISLIGFYNPIIAQTAVSTKNSSICDYSFAFSTIALDKGGKYVSQESLKDSCLNNFAGLVGLQNSTTNNVNYDSALVTCQQISNGNTKGQCFSVLAQKQSNAELCNYIIDEQDKGVCIRRVAEKTKNIEICEMEKGNSFGFYNTCVTDVARATGNVKYCERSIIGKMETSQGFCYKELAGILKNPELCNMIADEQYKKSCISVTKK